MGSPRRALHWCIGPLILLAAPVWAQSGKAPFGSKGDVGNLGWLAPAVQQAEATPLPFDVNYGFQFGPGARTVEFDRVPWPYGGTTIESKTLELAGFASGYRRQRSKDVLFGDYGATAGVSLASTNGGDGLFGANTEIGDAVRISALVGPELAVGAESATHFVVRGHLSFGPIIGYAFGNHGDALALGEKHFGWGSFFQFGVEAMPPSLPVAVGIGQRRLSFDSPWGDPWWGSSTDTSDHLFFLSLRYFVKP